MDKYLNESKKIVSWSSEVKSILYDNSLNHVYDAQQTFQVKTIVNQLKGCLFDKQQVLIENECKDKPKLRTFITFKDFKNVPPHIYKPLSFLERKTISKLRLGILPIRLETARYIKPVVPEEQQLCYCNNGEVESEYHVLFSCEKYDHLRQVWFTKLTKPSNFRVLPNQEKFKIALNDPNNVKCTAQYLIDMLDLRRLINNQY